MIADIVDFDGHFSPSIKKCTRSFNLSEKQIFSWVREGILLKAKGLLVKGVQDFRSKMPVTKFDLKVENLYELTHFQIDFHGAYIPAHSCLLAKVQPASTLCD